MVCVSWGMVGGRSWYWGMGRTEERGLGSDLAERRRERGGGGGGGGEEDSERGRQR